MEDIAQVALENGRDYSKLKEIKLIKGGSINEAFYVRTEEAQYFLKFHASAPEAFFKCESTGLRLIKETDTIAVPDHFSYSDQAGKGFLLMEWIEGGKTAETEVLLGNKLANMHQCYGRMHGFSTDTYIGLLPQPNILTANWLEYYRDYRLKSQIDQGIKRGVITGSREKKLLKLLTKLDNWIPSFVEPSYLHGDLYHGNWIVGPGGEPYLIDPSFLYGDRHLDLAFTELFGGFSEQFYEAYNETNPISKDYEDIKPLYQLYYLLAHLNLFGEAYGEDVDNILQRYVTE